MTQAHIESSEVIGSVTIFAGFEAAVPPANCRCPSLGFRSFLWNACLLAASHFLSTQIEFRDSHKCCQYTTMDHTVILQRIICQAKANPFMPCEDGKHAVHTAMDCIVYWVGEYEYLRYFRT